jgi:hypothetical protein
MDAYYAGTFVGFYLFLFIKIGLTLWAFSYAYKDKSKLWMAILTINLIIIAFRILRDNWSLIPYFVPLAYYIYRHFRNKKLK